MDGSTLQALAIIAIAVAMIVTLYEMGASLRPATCPECAHCRARAEDEARLQEELAREYARRNGFEDRDDDHRSS